MGGAQSWGPARPDGWHADWIGWVACMWTGWTQRGPRTDWHGIRAGGSNLVTSFQSRRDFVRVSNGSRDSN